MPGPMSGLWRGKGSRELESGLWWRDRLSAGQAEVVRSWLPRSRLLADHSRDGLDTAVLQVTDGQGTYIVKAAGASSHHIRREIEAHRSWTAVWAHRNRAPRIVRWDERSNILMTEYLTGSPVEKGAAEYDPEMYRQAGQLLRAFHDQASRLDHSYEAAANTKALSWIRKPHRIPVPLAERAKGILEKTAPEPVTVVPTHGDWQPRNWLVHGTELRIIDFGRYEFRPAITDFCRLAVQQWRCRPHLEAAFFEGYGTDIRDQRLWHISLLREAVSTAVWAYQVGDARFEQQGHRMLRDALANF